MTTQYATKYIMDFSGIISKRSSDLLIEPTYTTPFVKYSEDEEVLMIKGNSTNLDMHHFYYPVISKLKKYLDTHRSFKVYFFFKELNTSTIKVLFDLFKFISYKKLTGTEVEIAWGGTQEHPAVEQTGADFAELYDLNFKYVLENRG